MSRGNTANAKITKLWDIPPMEITREYQLKVIDSGIKRLGTSRNAFEKNAGVAKGSIKELHRGKRPMDAGKWQKITIFLGGNRVPLLGEIGVADSVNLISEFDEVLKKSPQEIKLMGIETFLIPSEFGDKIVHAWKVNKSWEGPLLRDGDMVWTTHLEYNNFDPYINSEVLVKLYDGRVFIKTLTGSPSTKKYNLLGIGVHGLMTDVKILWCAQIIGHIKKFPQG